MKNADGIDRLSIVIVTWQGDDLLRTCLDSLARIYDTAPEIVVVDNANEASTRRLAEGYPNVLYVATPRNLGFAGGNNIGLKRCTREHVLLLNNDTVVHEDSLSPLIDFLEKHPKVGVVQGTMNVPALDDGLDDCGVIMTPFGIQQHLHRGEPTATTPLKPRRVTAAKGAMMLLRRAVVADTGFLFYDHFGSYFEETDFCRRAANVGWETWFVPTPPIDHLCGATSTQFDRDAIWTQYFRNILYSFARNWGWWGRLVMLPAFCIAAFVKSPRNLVRAMRGIGEAALRTLFPRNGEVTPN